MHATILTHRPPLVGPRKVKPLLYTDEPICPPNQLACGDGTCIAKAFFCNGNNDCADGSDENACSKYCLWGCLSDQADRE